MNNITIKFLILGVFLGIGTLFTSSLYAQPTREKTPEQIRREIDKRTQKAVKRHEEMLKYLKKVDPEQYKQYNAQYERQKKIDQIYNDFQKKKISLDQAKTSLYPLIEAHAQNDLATLDKRIQELKNKIEQLKTRKISPSGDELTAAKARLQLLADIKSNPKKLIDFRIDSLLRQINPPQKDLLGAENP